MDKKDSSLMHSFSYNKNGSANMGMVFLILIIAAVLGAGTGYLLSKNKSGSPLAAMLPGGNGGSGGSVSVGKTYGSNDITIYKDSTEGALQSGGIDGEGQYHLVRPGGDSQNVYMTSSTVDLAQFLNHKIKVWGQTQAAQKAGWLMDVGKVEVLE